MKQKSCRNMKPANKTPNLSLSCRSAKPVRGASVLPQLLFLPPSLPTSSHLLPASNFIYFNKLPSDLPPKKKPSVRLEPPLPNDPPSPPRPEHELRSRSLTTACLRDTFVSVAFRIVAATKLLLSAAELQ